LKEADFRFVLPKTKTEPIVIAKANKCNGKIPLLTFMLKKNQVPVLRKTEPEKDLCFILCYFLFYIPPCPHMLFLQPVWRLLTIKIKKRGVKICFFVNAAIHGYSLTINK